MDQRLLPPEQLRWVTKLLGYDFEVQLKPGAANRVADALSRRGEALPIALMAISIPQLLDLEDIRSGQQADEWFMESLTKLQMRVQVRDRFIMKEGLLFYKDHWCCLDLLLGFHDCCMSFMTRC